MDKGARMSDNLKTTPDTPIVQLIQPFQEFAARETSGGILLLLCTVAALAWANSPWAHSYAALWQTPITVGIGGFTLSHDLRFWVNDALMAVFFFVVGLEIKRELLVGKLAQPRQAALPIVAAAGGVIVPALIYTKYIEDQQAPAKACKNGCPLIRDQEAGGSNPLAPTKFLKDIQTFPVQPLCPFLALFLPFSCIGIYRLTSLTRGTANPL